LQRVGAHLDKQLPAGEKLKDDSEDK